MIFIISTCTNLNYRTKILSFVCTLGVQLLAAQSPVTWSAPTKVDKSTELDEIAFADKDGAVLWRYDLSGLGVLRMTSLEAYNMSLERVVQTELPSEYQGNQVAGIRVVRLGKVPYLLMAGKMDENLSLMAWALDRNTLHPIGIPIRLFSLDLTYSKQTLRNIRHIYTADHRVREKMGEVQNFNGNYLQCAFNEDSTEVAIAYINSDQVLQIHVFDQSWKSRWKNSLTFKEPRKHIRYNEQAIVYHKGMVSMSYALIMTKEQRKEKGEVAQGANVDLSYVYHALSMRDEGKTVQDIVIDFGLDTLINSLQVLPQSDGTVRCIGTFTLKNKGPASNPANPLNRDMPPIAGLFQIRLSSEGVVIEGPHKALLIPLLLQNKASFSKISKIDYEQNEELLGFRPDRTISYENGSAIVIYQSVIILNELRKGGDRSYNDLVVVRFAPDGHPVWANVIPKRQATSQWHFLACGSYGLVQDKELLHFIYMDDASPDGKLQLSTLNAQGKVIATRQLIEPRSDIPPMPRLGIASGTNFLVPAERDNQFKLGWIKL